MRLLETTLNIAEPESVTTSFSREKLAHITETETNAGRASLVVQCTKD